MSDNSDSVPLRAWIISENEQANGTDPVLAPRKSRRIRTGHVRFMLALGLLVVIATMAIIGAVHWAIGGPGEIQELVVLMSPITTLSGAVFAFYFTDSRKKKRRK